MRIAIFLTAILFAAHAVAQPPAFEAATIKPSKNAFGHSGWHVRTGRITMDGQSLKSLIAIAYRVKESQVEGGPKWIDGDRFDINAKAVGAADQPEILLMLRTLLADRFQLALHHEQKIGLAYALVQLKSGLKIAPADGATGSNSEGSRGQLTAKGVSMAKLADILSGEVKMPVADLTGAPGAYDFKLQWAIEGDKDDIQSALFAALQQQLGLKLELRKMPVDMIVVDRAEKPSEN